ncbi:12022_t:CDS:2 [Gigaspora margarita]|uniref:12022_t:CDS:1 n=1 Tax=Gigaspora margarita TaxID=4874 RepID=A0ABN7UAV3_GIGMA|nr:12022_t:CDS:2 [Gigaspora margarita]
MPIPYSIQNIRAEINKLIAKVSRLTQCDIAQIDNTDLSTQKSSALISMLKRHRTAIWQAHNIENNNEHRDTINSYIEKRYSNFTNNTTLMIDNHDGGDMPLREMDRMKRIKYDTMARIGKGLLPKGQYYGSIV